MEEKIIATLNQIYNSHQHLSSHDASLMYGQSGIELFNFHFLRYTGQADFESLMGRSIENIAEKSFLMYDNPTFCFGRSGINWFFSHLAKYELLSVEDLQYLCDDSDNLKELALALLDQDNYDFLHGASGIVYYFLKSESRVDERFYKFFFEGIDKISDKGSIRNVPPYYNIENRRLQTDQFNIGLAHGLPNLIKIGMECVHRDICISESTNLVKRAIDFLIANVNTDQSRSFFSSLIVKGKAPSNFSRLAWCYGDLSLAFILYQASLLLKDKELEQFSLNILVRSTKRLDTKETLVYDAGICHGSAGIAHIYNKIWTLTNNPEFEDAGQYWIKKTLEFIDDTDLHTGALKYNSHSNGFSRDQYLLEGSAGIGLVLLSYLSHDFSWDECLLLGAI